jgi:hypothetical protein
MIIFAAPAFALFWFASGNSNAQVGVNTSGQPAVMKEMQKTIRQTQRFESDPANGDLFAGRSKRQYYFSTREGAVNDARQKAAAWLKQQAAVVCRPEGK